jgi:hypothetical protein
MIYPFIAQLCSYGVAGWLAFAGIAFVFARVGRGPGMVLGHIVVAVAVIISDLLWIQAEMHKPGWDGVPDQDFVFLIGVLLRIVMINTLLLPVSFIGWRLARRAPEPPAHPW